MMIMRKRREEETRDAIRDTLDTRCETRDAIR